ncbi:MAG: hypothetical protein K0Q55_1212 [Verrucomicrobia bacterium]|jgi:hypothetical protein|nr:hypothetical protein [Verrucomicrobiota bacterium]
MKTKLLVITALLVGVLPIVRLAGAPESFTAQKNRVFMAEDKVEARLKLLKDDDQGVYGLVVSLHNTADDRDIAVALNTYQPASFLITISDEKGQTVSKPLKKFTTEDTQTFETVNIPKGGTREWFFPIADFLNDKNWAAKGAKGSLFLSIACSYGPINTNGGLAEQKRILINLHDTDVLFTAKALAGNAKEKYERAVKQAK